jgi:hypothetical protein
MSALFDTIPGYREAVEQENALREAAFLLEQDEIDGVQVRPITVRHMLTLHGMRSPFVAGGEVRPRDVVLFLWVVSPVRGTTSLEAYSATFRKRNYVRLCAAIRKFVEDAFQDAPASTGNLPVPFWSWAAGVVDRIAFAYHWSEAAILDMPLARLFQYIKILDKRDDPNRILFNPSDKVRSRWLQEQPQN